MNALYAVCVRSYRHSNNINQQISHTDKPQTTHYTPSVSLRMRANAKITSIEINENPHELEKISQWSTGPQAKTGTEVIK